MQGLFPLIIIVMDLKPAGIIPQSNLIAFIFFQQLYILNMQNVNAIRIWMR